MINLINNFDDKILTPKALSIKKLKNNKFNIPLSYFISHEDLQNIFLRVDKFQSRLEACALSADALELIKLRDDIKNLDVDNHWIVIFEEILERNKDKKDWIIRSAFSCEDQNQSAFAGNFLSQKVSCARALDMAKSLFHVLSSFFEPSAFLNILSQNTNFLNIRFGVVIQAYINGQISGVGFSRDPDKIISYVENKNNLNGYTEWVFNTCDALTSGRANTARCDLSLSGADKLIFLKELIKGAKKLEKLFCAPIDFEWTFDGKTLWWLQARPIASEECRRVLKIKSGMDLSREKVAERFPEIITPMGWSLIRNTLRNSLISFGDYIKIKFIKPEEAAYFYKGLVYSNNKYYNLKNCKPKLLLLLLIPAFLYKLIFKKFSRANLYIFHNLILKSISAKILEDWALILENNIPQIKKFDGKFIDYKSCLEKMQTLRDLGQSFFKADIATHFLREAYQNLIKKALMSLKISEHDAVKACAQFSDNITLKMHRDLIAIKNSSDRALLVKNFLQQHGHITMSWDVADPTLLENPEALELLIKNFRASTDKSSEAKKLPINYAKNKTLIRALKNAQDLARTDEQQHFFAGLHVSKARELLLSLAHYWQSHNILFEVEDIFYLTIDEVEQFLREPKCAIKFVARRRKKIWQRYADADAHQIIDSKAESRNNLIQGIAASPGRATGTLFVAQNWNDLAKMPLDAILYLRTPNPSYVPWFDHCKALLTETGGVLSHGFIAARELHIPAVSGIPIEFLKNKNLVTVDGNSGEVLFH